MKQTIGKSFPFFFIASFIYLFTLQSFAQYVPRAERGDPAARRKSNIDTNNVRTTIFNFGQSGRTGAVPDQVPYEWPKNTKRYYIALEAPFVGGEVRLPNDSIIHIVDVPNYRLNPSMRTWNFEPVPGYLNSSSNSIARSDDPSTWPGFWPDKEGDGSDPGWPGKWNGILGKDKFINGAEFYYHFTDNNYDRYPYFPDSTDTTRKGLGIAVSRRVLEFREPPLADAVVFVDDIYNAGTRPIDKTATTYWLADFVGGDVDAQNNHMYYDRAENIAWFTDNGTGGAPFQGTKVGAAAFALLQAPGNLGFTRYQYLPAGAINFSTTADNYFWEQFMVPSMNPLDNYNPLINLNGDYDGFISCGFFSLPPGASERFATAVIIGANSSETRRKAKYLRSLAAGEYRTNTITFVVASPAPHQIITGPLSWQTGGFSSGDAKLDFYISSDDGDTWRLLEEGRNANTLNPLPTDSLKDGILYKLSIVAYDSAGLGYAETPESFTINNIGSAPPQIRLDRTLSGRNLSGSVPISWYAGDADGDSVRISLFYRMNATDSLRLLDSNLANTGSYSWNTLPFPNAGTYFLKAIISDGVLTGIDSVGPFSINNTRYGLGDSASTQRNASGSGKIEVHIADTTQLTGDTYRVIFSNTGDTTITYHVEDVTKTATVLQNSPPIINNSEGPIFDGLRLLVNNDKFKQDLTLSGWNRPSVHQPYIVPFSFNRIVLGIQEAADYIIIVGGDSTDTSIDFNYQVSPVRHLIYPSRPVNFTVLNRKTHARVPFAFGELVGSDGILNADILESDDIILLTKNSQDSLVPSWRIWLSATQTTVNPQSGDTANLYLFKPFQTGDEYTFKALKGSVITGIGPHPQEPVAYELSQNYPNPFNPETEIRFSLNTAQTVQLDIYNILGQKIRMLIDERLGAGMHTIRWDGRNAAGQTVGSGVYFYRINAGPFTQVKKMLLMR